MYFKISRKKNVIEVSRFKKILNIFFAKNDLL